MPAWIWYAAPATDSYRKYRNEVERQPWPDPECLAPEALPECLAPAPHLE